MRLECWIRSFTSASRSRDRRRWSSSSGLGGRTIEHTRRSPRPGHQRAQQRVDIEGVGLAPSFRRSTAIEAGSTTRLSMPLASSRRCSQNPSRPASWMTTTLTGLPIRRSAFSRPGEQVEQRAPVTGGYGALGDLLLARRVGCHEPGLAAEFQRRKQGAIVGSGGGRSR